MLLGHAGAGMAELGRNDAHRHALHGEVGAVRVPQNVERNVGDDPGAGAGLFQGVALVGLTPDATVVAQEHDLASRPACRPLLKAARPLGGQRHVARLPFASRIAIVSESGL